MKKPNVCAAVALACALVVAGCGGGGSVNVGVVVVENGVSVPRLDIVLSRAGPQAIRIDWSDDTIVATFTVTRDGLVLAAGLDDISLIDASVYFNVQYCYQVLGYDRAGHVVSATDSACIVV